MTQDGTLAEFLTELQYACGNCRNAATGADLAAVPRPKCPPAAAQVPPTRRWLHQGDPLPSGATRRDPAVVVAERLPKQPPAFIFRRGRCQRNSNICYPARLDGQAEQGEQTGCLTPGCIHRGNQGT